MRTNYGIETLEVEHGILTEKIGGKKGLLKVCDQFEVPNIQNDIKDLEKYVAEIKQCIEILRSKLKDVKDEYVENKIRKPWRGAKMAKCEDFTYSYCYNKCEKRGKCKLIGKRGRPRLNLTS